MASFLLSPGVQVTEKDLTSIVPAVSTSAGAYAGAFRWGPVMDPIKVPSEDELVSQFGAPNTGTAMSFFTAANFLSYANNLLVVRVDALGQKNAVATQTGGVAGLTATAPGSAYTTPTVTISAPQTPGGIQATATATVVGGEIVGFTVTNPGSGYTTATATITDSTGSGATATVQVATGGIKINNANIYDTNYVNGGGLVGEFAAKYPGSIGNSIKISMADSATYSTWDYKDEFTSAPAAKELHIIVIDEDGMITKTPGAVLEKFPFCHKASDGKRDDGTNVYYKNVLNVSSRYVWWMDHPAGMVNWGSEDSPSITFTNLATPVTISLTGGSDDFAVTDGNLMNGFALFNNVETYDISLIVVGKASATVATYVINNVAEVRKDCVAFISPQDINSGEPIIGTTTKEADRIVAYRNLLPSSSYAVMDSGFKYQYDRYNDVYRWVPLNADVAGACARTDFTDDPWFSPGGYTRGQIKNVVRLAYNPDQVGRDTLYKSGVNPVVSFAGQGTILYGDKTLYAKPSAFDRINVRRLFIVLEKAIATAAKYQMFEFNDSFTRAQFRSMVEPFLRDVQGRRGVTDFRVKCDETNNTGTVIERNEFVADIFIKPARSINFVSLNFIAARSSVSFEEIGG